MDKPFSPESPSPAPSLTSEKAGERKQWKSVLKSGILFLSLAGIVAFLHLFDMQHATSPEWADNHLRSTGVHGIALYITLTAILSAVGFPRQALSALGGYAFGAAYGTLWSLVGLTCGCACGFFYARLLGRSSLRRKFGKRLQKLDAFFSHRPFSMSIAIRLLPVGSNVLTTLAAGLTSIPALHFIAGSALGYLPQTLIFALLGSGIRVDPEVRVTASALLFILSSYIGYRLYKTFPKT